MQTGARSPLPSALAAPLERSMIRPLTNGPRSLMRTTMLLPVRLFHTLNPGAEGQPVMGL